MRRQPHRYSNPNFSIELTFYNRQFIEKADNGYDICDGIYKMSGRFPEDYMPKV